MEVQTRPGDSREKSSNFISIRQTSTENPNLPQKFIQNDEFEFDGF